MTDDGCKASEPHKIVCSSTSGLALLKIVVFKIVKQDNNALGWEYCTRNKLNLTFCFPQIISVTWNSTWKKGQLLQLTHHSHWIRVQIEFDTKWVLRYHEPSSAITFTRHSDQKSRTFG